jgi:hypothetical protein
MTSKSKTKGNNFERSVAKMLNEMYSTEEFSRAPTSGAFFGKSNAIKKSGASEHAKLTLAGDLTTPASFPFTIECKNYAATGGPNPYALLRGDSDSTLDGWLKQVSDDGAFKGRKPCLFINITPRKGTFFCIPFNPAVLHTDVPFTKYTSSSGVHWMIFGIKHLSLLHTL